MKEHDKEWGWLSFIFPGLADNWQNEEKEIEARIWKLHEATHQHSMGKY